LVVACGLLAVSWSSPGQQSATLSTDRASESIWERGVGEGFRCGAQSLTLTAGATYGLTAMGSQQAHDIVLGGVTYGRMLDNTIGAGRFYGGNFELRLELLGGVQVSPRVDGVVALSPHLRYNFSTGTRWVPFIDGGAGVAATSIREPDLGGTVQFDIQGIVGVQRFLRDDMAVTFQAGYLHMSSAGLYQPNLGVNCISMMAGVSFYF
jgi:hypothetical protein